MGFTTVLVQRDERRIKENKKKKTKPFCTLVVARLSSSEKYSKMTTNLAKLVQLGHIGTNLIQVGPV